MDAISRDDLRPTTSPWQFPKRTAKSNCLSAVSFETTNRFNGLGDYEISNNNPFESSKTTSARETINDEPTAQKTTRNVVPGKHSYADAVILNRQTVTDKSNPQHASPKVVKRRPYAHTEAFEIRSNLFGDFCSQTQQNSIQEDF